MKTKIVSLLLVLTLILAMIPLAASAATPGTVYISISDDAQFITAPDGTPIAFYPVKLETLESIDLAAYGLEHFVCDTNHDGKEDLTALHLYIYVHEKILGMDWADVTVSGSAGSIYFSSNMFGFSDENLRYDLNGAYPAIDGWGVTADQLVLSEGDFLNVAHYTSWAFWMDSAVGFHYFTDPEGSLQREFSLTAGQSLTVRLVRSYSDWMNGGLPAYMEEPDYDICYGKVYGSAEGTVTTDPTGQATLSFSSAGTWYLWADGGFGAENPYDIVSAPAFAQVHVAENPVAVAEKMIAAIGTVSLDSEAQILAARAAFDALTEAQKQQVSNTKDLTDAEAKLTALKEAATQNQTLAAEATGKIDAIGAVTVFSGEKVKAARAAFDALTAQQKALVENQDMLIAAEAALAELYEAAASTDHKTIYQQTAKYLENLGTPYVGSTGGEWMVIAMTRAGQACPEGYYKNVEEFVKANINENAQLHRAKSTENARVILGLTAAGYDVTNVAGHNLLKGLTDMSYVKKQGINGPIWALIAFDSHSYEIPDGGNVTREGLINTILDAQLADGGWALSGKIADPDITGMAIQALAPYYGKNAAVTAAVDKALVCLSNMQLDNGGYGSLDGTCAESCAQVIVALTALGIDPETDPRFVKNGMSVVDAMCLFAVDGGGFSHIPGTALNGMATEQSQYALAAYYRFSEGKSALYDMGDVQIQKQEQQKPADPAKPSTPVTGDNTPVALLSTLLIISLLGILSFGILVNKKHY